MPLVDDPEARAFATRLRYERLAAGRTVTDAADATNIEPASWTRYERSQRVPRPWTLDRIAAALNVPAVRLMRDCRVVAEVEPSEATIADCRARGMPAALEAAERMVPALAALILAEATRPPVDTSPGARPKRRRSRTELLGG